MNGVMVSIYVATYNHEKYITQALDSILMQETQYSYEVFVGEDCSTDNTRQVLKAWENLHPGKFTILYRDKNMYGQTIDNAMDLKMRCKGKYIIALEGDDFWTDAHKLEKQVSFLEDNPEYYAVAHNCLVVGADSKSNGEEYPECKDIEYTLRHLVSEVMPGQLTTVLSRNYMCDPQLDKTLVYSNVGPGDRNIYFTLCCCGKVYCMQQIMSAYRHITVGGSSYSATYTHQYEIEQQALKNRMIYAQESGNQEAIYCACVQYLLYLRYAWRKKVAPKKALYKDFSDIPKGWRYLPILLKRDINRFLLHKVPNI